MAMELGAAPSIALAADLGIPVDDLLALAGEAERAGFAGVWTQEHEYDSYALNQAIAGVTTGVTTGSCVARAFARHPLLAAQTSVVIDRVAPGRFVIGIGAGPSRSADPRVLTPSQRWGCAFDRPVRYMREYVEVLRLALSGEPVRFSGEYFTVDGVRLDPPAGEPMPIWMAAGGEQMTRLAGRVADGVFVHMVDRQETVATLRTARDAAESAGRDPESVQLGNLVMTCVDEDADVAREAMRVYLLDNYLHLPRYRGILARTGFEAVSAALEGFRPSPVRHRLAGELLADADIARLRRQVPDELVDAFTVCGTPADCRRKLQEVRDWGTALPILYAYPARGGWAHGYRDTIGAFARPELRSEHVVMG
jgi:5,10-methylenetetrahydromethanopterin reductase